MPRTKSILLFGEGKTEGVFLSHLRDLYRSPEIIVKVEHGRGGSGKTVVLAAINASRLADYSGVLVLLDSDREEDDIPAKWCTEHRLSIRRSSPCLEALLLDILQDPRLRNLRNGSQASAQCKSRFRSEHLGTDQSTAASARLRGFIQRSLTKGFLDEARKRISILDEIIHAIQGGM